MQFDQLKRRDSSRFLAARQRCGHSRRARSQRSAINGIGALPPSDPRRSLGVEYHAAPLAMMWNTNPSTIIPTATAAIGSRTSAVAFAPLTGPVKVSNSPTAQSRKLG
jgi:hypothetical protein